MLQPRFAKGQNVQSLVDAQGMRKGGVYRVADVDVQVTPFGGFTSYLLATQTQVVGWVRNGHLLLKPA